MVWLITTLFICAVCGYLIGSINTAMIVGVFYNVDVRKHGSGNAGTTNVLRTLGGKAALMTFAGDFLKGITAYFLGNGIVIVFMNIFGKSIFNTVSAWQGSIGLKKGLFIYNGILRSGNLLTGPSWWITSIQLLGGMAAVLLCVIGHNWPVYFGYKGGKGVLASFAAALCIAPVPALFSLAVFILVTAVSRYVSLASVVAAVFFPVFIYFSYIINLCGTRNAWTLLFGILLAVLIIVRHGKNIKRLLNKTENKLSLKKVKGGIE